MILAIAASVISLGGTTVTIQPTTEPGAIAEIIFRNISVNSPADEGTQEIDLNGLTVAVTFGWNIIADQDQIIVTPPDGVICEPRSCELTIPEDDTGTLYLKEWVGG